MQKGFMIFYLNVEKVSRVNRENYINQYKTQLREFISQCKETGYPLTILPVVDGSNSRVEKFDL